MRSGGVQILMQPIRKKEQYLKPSHFKLMVKIGQRLNSMEAVVKGRVSRVDPLDNLRKCEVKYMLTLTTHSIGLTLTFSDHCPKSCPDFLEAH